MMRVAIKRSKLALERTPPQHVWDQHIPVIGGSPSCSTRTFQNMISDNIFAVFIIGCAFASITHFSTLTLVPYIRTLLSHFRIAGVGTI